MTAMIGYPTRLTEICRAYNDQLISWPGARGEILNFPFRVVDLTKLDMSPYDPSFTPQVAGTWDDMVRAYRTGLIGDPEYHVRELVGRWHSYSNLPELRERVRSLCGD